MVIQHNLGAVNAERQLGIVTSGETKSVEKLSSGYKINRAADDAAGLAISEKMRQVIRGLKRGVTNTYDGVSFVQIADGAMNEIHDMLQRVNELAIQAANGTNSDSDRNSINDEVEQIKTEINRIAETTKFNESRIFDGRHGVPSVSIGAWYMTRDDITLYDNSYDSATGEVVFGGVLYKNERISWDKFDQNMVDRDATGKITGFHAGKYSYNLPDGTTLICECSAGDMTPRVSRLTKLDSFDAINHFYIDGKRYSWDDLVDEDGNPMPVTNIHSGIWHVSSDPNAPQIVLSVSGMDNVNFADIEEAARQGLIDRPDVFWQERFPGITEKEKAVNARGMRAYAINNDSAKKIEDTDNDHFVEYRLRADDGTTPGSLGDGIWGEKRVPVKQDGVIISYNYEPIEGSFQSWEALGRVTYSGIASPDGIADAHWDSGTQIADLKRNNTTLTYMGTSDITGIISINVQSRVTSKDSLIDGINNMPINGRIRTRYTPTATESDDNVLSVTVSSWGNPLVRYEEEKDIGRDFNQQLVNNVIDNVDDGGAKTVTTDSDNQTVTIDFKKNNTDIQFTGSTGSQINQIKSNTTALARDIIARKKRALIRGKDPGKLFTDLKEVVGASNITGTGHYDQQVTISNTMHLTGSTNMNATAHRGAVGSKYSCAMIDFAQISSSNLMDLDGCGFDSTCHTCSNHYSIRFTASDTPYNTKITASDNKDYDYKFRMNGSDNYILDINLNTLAANGVTGANLATVVADIAASTSIASHYTQYASEGTKLYIYDDRTEYAESKTAQFYTVPYDKSQIGNLNYYVNTKKDGRTLNLTYEYNYMNLMDNIDVSMKQDDNNGEYVYNSVSKQYEVYYPSNYPDPHNQPHRYNIEVEYKHMSDGSSAVGATENEKIADMLDDYAKTIVDQMLKKTEIQFNARDYTRIDWEGRENPNQAVKAQFESRLSIEGWHTETGLRIQHSSAVTDSTWIPQFLMDTYELGMLRADVRTQQNALATINMVSRALHKVSQRRSLYGALQNRMEHTIKNRSNTMENTQAAESRIRDTDMAEEMVKYSKANILRQAGQSMLSQANQSSYHVLGLLE